MADFKTQIKLIDQSEGGLQYSYFGGKAAFDRAMAFANGQESPTNAPPAP
jgi:hypothetical protein